MTNTQTLQAYTAILRDELKTAMGCTEPIALAYAAAYAKSLLDKMPDACRVLCSGNIVKNVKAVTVPQTGGLKGIEAAVLAGLIGGDATRQLEVLTALCDADRTALRKAMGSGLVTVKLLETEHLLHIVIELAAGADTVSVELVDGHTNLGRVVHNGAVLHERTSDTAQESALRYDLLTVSGILAYAQDVSLCDIGPLLEEQIEKNTQIAEEGLTNDWGAAVGKTLLACSSDTVWTRARATAAAGSDARMNGCAMPVVINSGSGNQGMTVSLPVVVYAREKKLPHDALLRGLCVSNLIAIRQKREIGKLSAFCGAVCAAVGAAAGIAYLDGEAYETISQTIVNAIASIGGMVCDGAKSSCAGKIASALDCAFLGYEMARKGHGYHSGDGLVKDDVEQTIDSVGIMARDGMRATDQEILRLMV